MSNPHFDTAEEMAKGCAQASVEGSHGANVFLLAQLAQIEATLAVAHELRGLREGGSQ